MPFIQYITKKFSPERRSIIDSANRIIEEYQAEGFVLTLRQLFYQFVSRDLLANTVRSYKKLGKIVSDARRAGLIDWNAIEDRLRIPESNAHWRDPADIISACEKSFQIDKWQDQLYLPQVWIEKDALAGVIEPVCRTLDITFFACRGFGSDSSFWRAARQFKRALEAGRRPIIFHLGDHDPSGIDMTRDIAERIGLFLYGEDGGAFPDVERLALNMDQIETYSPPPNPAKMADSRYESYVRKYGNESWELDALDPRTLSSLIEDAVVGVRDDAKWKAAVAEEKKYVRELGDIRQYWDEVVDFVKTELDSGDEEE